MRPELNNNEDRISYTQIVPGSPGRHPADYSLLAAAIPVLHIPVYLDSLEDWKAKEQGAVERRFEEYAKSFGLSIDEARVSRPYQVAMAGFDPMAWDYNQVVGWLRLWAGSIIWAECWWPAVKSLRRKASPRVLMPHGAVFQCDASGLDSPVQRFELARHALEGLKAMPPFRRRYIDLSQFMSVGPNLNWTSLEIQGLVRSLPSPRT